MDNLEQALEEYLDRLSDVMVNQLMENRSFKTGNLARSIKSNNVVVPTTDGMKGTLTMNWYGTMVDAGVMGSVSNKKFIGTNPQSFAKPGKFKHIAVAKDSGLPTAVRFSMGRYGFKAKPFLKDSFRIANETFGEKLLTEAGIKDINEQLMKAFKQ